MSVPTRTPLGPSTVQRNWYIDVNTGTPAVPTWTPLLGMTNLDFNPDDANWEDDTDFDSGGFGSQTKSGAAWGAVITLARKATVADVTEYDAGQEFLRGKAIGQFGVANSVEVRIYEMEPDGPREEAYFGQAGVQWAPQGGAGTALKTVQCTLNGQGELAPISHPDTASATAPALSSITPSTGLATAGGTLVRIRGNSFTGTTGVTIAGSAATEVAVESDNLIVCKTPAHSAATVANAVVVTNAVGASTAALSVTFA